MVQMKTISESHYAKKASKYLEILNQLRGIGAQFAVNLPTIVFCGNQSAGKSSLLEAISGVQLPRSDGTCTRCVMELRLTESQEPWQCQVFLRLEYDKDGKTPLPRTTETKFGNSIDDPKDVELMARRAQKALLNPSNNSDQYIDWDFNKITYDNDADTNNLKFTKNVVCLEIKGNDVPNLSLIDLPGIIHHTEKIEDKKFVKLIRDLVESYIKREESIIIATISCKDEIENQEIVSLARTVDPSGLRTLGVLTKPDMIEQGTHEPWLRIMKGEAHKLSLGYYVIKNPNKKRLMENITFEEAREEEIDFFENESPWKDNYEFNERIGVKKLQSKLSDLLIKAIMHDLPIINKEIQRKLEETRKELEKIPEPLGKNPRVELIYLIGKCVTGINESLDDNAELWCFINTEFIKFKKGLRSSRPVFVVGKDSTRNIAKFDVLEKFTHDPNDPILEEGMEITEAQITNQINKLRGRSLPGTTPYSAIIKLIESSQGQWKNPSLDCLDRVYCIMVNLVEKIVDETFSRFPNSHAQVKLYTNKWLDNCKEKTVEHIDFMFELERDNNHPFTLDSSEMVGKKVKYLNELHQAVRNEMRQPTDTLEVIASVMAYFSIAFKRYADNISKTIIHSFIYGFTKHIEEKLVELFISGDNDYDIDELVREDYNISSRREELKIKEKHMREVLDSLVRFGLK